jgi:hypothetical protein
MGGQARRVLAGADLLDLGAPPPAGEPLPPAMERMYVGLLAACDRMLGGEDAGQQMLLARDGCMAGADGPDGAVLRAIGALLDQIDDRATPDRLRLQHAPGFDLAVVAATVARTPAVPEPDPEVLRSPTALAPV